MMDSNGMTRADEAQEKQDVVTDFAGRVICRRVFTGEEADHDR